MHKADVKEGLTDTADFDSLEVTLTGTGDCSGTGGAGVVLRATCTLQKDYKASRGLRNVSLGLLSLQNHSSRRGSWLHIYM